MKHKEGVFIKMMNRLKKTEVMKYSLMIFMILQPIVELDLYLQEFYNQLSILSLSTLIRIVGVVLLAFLALLQSKHWKKEFILWSLYGVLLAMYTFFHFKYSRDAIVLLPQTYQWVGSFELKYLIFLVLPYLLMYSMHRIKFSKQEINTIVLFVSMFISLNIFISNLLVSSYGSYGSITYQNIFTWFTDIYASYTPRELTSIGFYFFANPIGGLLFILFPLLIKAFYEEKAKWLYLVAIVIQMLTMFMIGSKVASYGVVLCLLSGIILNLFFVILKQMKLQKMFIISLVLLLFSSIIILPKSPAYVNASFDYEDEFGFASNERDLKNSLEELSKIEDEKEYKYALIHRLETIYIYYLTFPREYYEYYYPYQYDPEFYFDVLSLPFEQRKGGRQFQRYFMTVKFNELKNHEKYFGLGYSKMSQGGIILEQDFFRQYYVLGSLGAILFTGPYLIIWFGLGIVMLIKIRNKKYFNYENTVLFLSYSLAMITSYYSGHILDEPIVSLFIAWIAGMLFSNYMEDKHEA